VFREVMALAVFEGQDYPGGWKVSRVMLPLITAKRAELEALCRKHHVHRLDVFGSAARGDFDLARSDIDFLVEFDQLPAPAYADSYFGLMEDLGELFERRVDLVTVPSVRNPYLKDSIEKSRELLFAA
jgi:uncharacterized protein